MDLSTNTTQHLIGDIEALRMHLEIDQWLVWGGSWGTTLALAYAQTHPNRVSEMILVSVVTTTRTETEWVTRAMGRVFPAEWERFVAVVPDAERGGDLAAAYSRLLHDPDPETRSGPHAHGAHGRTPTSPRHPAIPTTSDTTIPPSACASPGWSRTTGATLRSSMTGRCCATSTVSLTSRRCSSTAASTSAVLPTSRGG